MSLILSCLLFVICIKRKNISDCFLLLGFITQIELNSPVNERFLIVLIINKFVKERHVDLTQTMPFTNSKLGRRLRWIKNSNFVTGSFPVYPCD